MKKITLAGLVLAATMALSSVANAAVDVSHKVSGGAGSWVYEFTVANNLDNTNGVYFFGVLLGDGQTLTAPAGFNDSGAWNDNASYGGSATVYNRVWYKDYSTGGFMPGTSATFTVLDTSADYLTDVRWFAFAWGGSDYGPDCYNCGLNPGYEGNSVLTNVTTGVPEPATWAMMITGFGLAGAALRRSRKTREAALAA